MKQLKFLAAALLLAPSVGAVIPAVAIAQADEGYRLGPDDQIDVMIYGTNDATIRTRVKSNGTITLPMIGSVAVSGETVQSLAGTIERKLKSGGYINNPIVNVEISGFISRSVTLLGEVGQPGIQPLDRPQTLGEMIARVGGLKGSASDLVTLRHAGSDQTEVYSLSTIGRSAARDVRLRPGDVVYVAPAEHYFIYGQVGSAGVHAILPNMSIRQALAAAGGPSQSGSEKKITLYRGGREQDANLAELIRPDDVLFVRERVF